MIENILVFLVISMLVYSAKDERAVGWLVLSYYATYIVIALDFFGGIISGNLFTTYDHFMVWYLIYTAISLIFFIASLVIFINTRNKTPLMYAVWILLNMVISGLSSIFQAFETNALLFVYNVLQNINLFVDIMVVIIGTDNRVRRTKYATNIIDSVSGYIDSRINRFTSLRHRNI